MSQSGFPQGYEGTPIDTPSNNLGMNRNKIRKNANPLQRVKGIDSPFGPRRQGILEMGINKYKQTTNSKSSQPQLMFRNRPTVPEQLSERSREMKLDEHSRSMFYSQNHANKPISIQDDHKPVQKQLHSSLNLGESRSNWKRAEAMKPNSENPVCKIPIDRVWEYPDKSEWGTANNLTITNYHLEVTGSKNIKFNPDDIKRITYHSGEYTLLKIDGRNDKVILSTKENIVKHLARMQNFGTVMAMSDPEIAEAMTLAVNEKRRTSKRFSKDSDDDYVDEYISYEPMGQAKETPKKRNKIELAQEDRFYKKEEAPVRKSSRLSGVGAMQTNEIIFNYPHKGRYCISVREQDVARLNEGEFLNDTVIEFYIRYLCEINADNPTYQKTHFFNSFFFEQLMSSKDERKFEFAYERIRKWTNRVDIFEKDYLIIPVNENLHWYLAIVYNPGACLLELKETDMDLVEEVVAESKVISDETLEYSQQLVQELSSNLVPDNSTIETLSETNGSTLNQIENSDQSMEIDDDVQPNEDAQDDDQSPEITEIPPNLVNSTGEATEVGGFKTVKPKSYETPKIGISKIFKATSEVHQIADSNQGTAEAQSTGISLRSKSVPKRKTAKLKAVDSFSDPAKCKVFILDSLGHSRPKTLRTIKNYLVMEARYKKHVEINEKEIKGSKLDVPIQPNHCDCGVYLLEYVESFLGRVEELLPKILNREAKPNDWFTGNYVIRQKRCDIQHLMLSLKEKEVELKKNAPPPVVVVHDDDDLIIVE